MEFIKKERERTLFIRKEKEQPLRSTRNQAKGKEKGLHTEVLLLISFITHLIFINSLLPLKVLLAH